MFDLITGLVESTGYFGVALLMMLEHVFPPIPSELIMPLAGYTAAQGKLSLTGVIVAGSLGSVIGTSLWYWLGRRLSRRRLEMLVARHGRWFTTDVEGLHQAEAYFEKYGRLAVLLGRVIPTVRTLISVPAGVVNMPLLPFLLLTSIGSTLWTALLTIAGYLLQDNFDAVSSWLNPVSTLIVVVLVGWYLYRVITFGRKVA